MRHDQVLLLHRYNALCCIASGWRVQLGQQRAGRAGFELVMIQSFCCASKRRSVAPAPASARHLAAVGRHHVDQGAGGAQAVGHQFAAAVAADDQHRLAAQRRQVQAPAAGVRRCGRVGRADDVGVQA
jgi:hypothetical protein